MQHWKAYTIAFLNDTNPSPLMLKAYFNSAFSQAVPAPQAAQFPTRFWITVFIGFSMLALAVMWSRWGGTVEDSLAYFNTARFFRGEIPATELRAPFPYRILVPSLAAFFPGDVRNNFALLNWLAVSAAAFAIALSAARIGMDKSRALLAGGLLILSVPTFWYAPYLLTDPGSVCARAFFVLGVLSGQPWLAAIAGLVGTLIREENILLLVWLVAMRRIALLPGIAALGAAGLCLVSIRWYLIPGLPSYTWVPHFAVVLAALADVRSLASIAAAIGVVFPLALLGWRKAPPVLAPLKSLILLMALPPLYAALCVRVDGRAVWGLYPMLIPFAISYLHQRSTASK
ncbi:hypothetical protein [Massilia sp. TS11]|uniref:hypothetical protein n=1 Tax=Massilia sp. TS11 TaxID=2908003 RepID=UPI001EDC0B36|nr:hypothetical protein [Massilia sp. TS11]MCG2586835.1 hypothetical protein [Massilia sp. TS11]